MESRIQELQRKETELREEYARSLDKSQKILEKLALIANELEATYIEDYERRMANGVRSEQ